LQTALNNCKSTIKGSNPFKVNVITFSGHGFTVGRDAIAAIPDHTKEKVKNKDGIEVIEFVP
jgi:hypothetical protein